MLIAVEEGYGEPLAWHGSGSKKLGLCWIPEVINNSGLKGSSNVKGSIKVDTKKGEKLEFDRQNKGIKITGSEYIITWKDKGTKEGIEAVDKGRMLIVPNREEWKSDKPFALLTLRIKDKVGLDDKEKLVDKITDKEIKNVSTQEYEKLKNILQRQINKSISRDDLIGVHHRVDLLALIIKKCLKNIKPK
ncbi:5426_t:CDS:2 [Paraglomus occultum]|uniref:5426_t:CDS:1 n=1 Tax=Paraglomus occultum TaxID=144539 RepID=A0A9N8ZQ99_9GLOM|nr:5426_t:CDS:2 [Paraglomus occultum]